MHISFDWTEVILILLLHIIWPLMCMLCMWSVVAVAGVVWCTGQTYAVYVLRVSK